ncbi:[citrate (pro-3S)-lyase] ligase [Marinisporobacter balticus]|uniref:[Citrate [pro-3S]-lyase] ligase n=1 Tax=Marinisporobacter balticus TaxID=2018667 RepID=A0A4R2L170_9FIRM|nr:[citrate (pro-3S)-lyase] ligase [Marinisporobacter balticus]TCO79332.1 [citrate (pro-3S)-lyase] ligase [Marinisporobacter balticus]
MIYEGFTVTKDFTVEKIYMDEKKTKKQVLDLLEKNDLTLDIGLEDSVGVYDGENLIATGSIKGNTLRCIAIDQDYQGTSVLNLLMDTLVRMQYMRERSHLFVYTKPTAQKSFQFMGFHKIEEVNEKVILMENKMDGIKSYLDRLSKHEVSGDKISAIVMNANPFTNGHLYLIERASKESDHVHVFMVSSDISSFPYSVRKQLITEGTKHIKNITLHEGGDYIISNATFPSYFIKEKSEIVKIHATLDLKIFAKYIGPSLGIHQRYVGEEPYCETTHQYNQVMKMILPQYGIDVKEIARKAIEDGTISASKVRDFIATGNIEKINSFVPEATYTFLASEEGKKIIHKIQKCKKRH